MVHKAEKAIRRNAKTPINPRFKCINRRFTISKSDTMKPMASARSDNVMAAGKTMAAITITQNQKPYLEAFANKWLFRSIATTSWWKNLLMDRYSSYEYARMFDMRYAYCRT